MKVSEESRSRHRNPMIEWKFLNSAKQILKELEGENNEA